ncbi:MAG: MarR family transcriptional regulator [Bacilli bacterium]|nr:MarR family transcriptional regulator [Bacilli bacterium]
MDNFKKPRKKNTLILANEITKVFHNYLRVEAEKVGITATYRPIIMMLSYKDGLTQLDIAKKTHMSPPTISLTLQKMEQSNLVRREEDLLDKRQVRIFITEDGKKLDDEIRKLITKAEKVIFENISLEEQKRTEEILEKVLKNLMNIGGLNEENF